MEKSEYSYVTILLIPYILFLLYYYEQVVEEAISQDVGAIIAYHPIIFSGMKKLNPMERVPRLVMQYAIKKIISMQMYKE